MQRKRMQRDIVYGESPRRRHGLQQGWQFARNSALKDRIFRRETEWQEIDLPHCWNGQDTFQKGVVYYQGLATYKRTFSLPASVPVLPPEPFAKPVSPNALAPAPWPQRWHLVAGGFYGLAEVRLDGQLIAKQIDGQYLGFRLDITDLVKPQGSHGLELRMTNRCPKWVLPGTDEPDFLVHGGLAGGLFLESVPSLRLLEEFLEVRTENLLGSNPKVVLKARWLDETDARQRGTVQWTVLDPAGEPVAVAETEESRGTETQGRKQELGYGGYGKQGLASPELRVEIPIASPDFWSPKNPSLYTAVAELQVAGRVVDRYSFRFGLRETSFSDEGFFLNGERFDLHGFNRHEAVPGLGNALPRWLHREDAETIKAHGGNFVRLSHYPQHPDFLDACDELGLFVYAEVASWKSVQGGRWIRSARRQMRSMILRDRHRPSTLLWGMGNESRHRQAYEELGNLIRELDPGRASIYAENHLYRARRQGILGLPDVWGCNYELDVLEEGRDAARLKSVIVSEVCNDLASRGVWEAEKQQLESLNRFWATIEGKPYVAGYTLWSYNDYATMHRDRFTRTTGKFDPWHLPKMSASLFAARHGEKPILRLFGDWGKASGGETEREIIVITNCQEVEILLDGRTVAVMKDQRYGCFRMGYSDLDLVAEGSFFGRQVRDVLPAHGPARTLILRPEQEQLCATSRQWGGVLVEAVDESGHRDRSYSGVVQLHLSGDVTTGAWSRGCELSMASGIGRTFLRAKGAPGVALLRAAAPGLESGVAEIPLLDRSPTDSLAEL